ncbi:hydrolase [Marinobacterium nitratireducens]|uniref:Hydrolase n=1 Tax=Marinobacterium nitratireducens TaxID=518897 RepID=A0A917Z8M0_9GAMM|nr:HAD-IA family hydrolase [Marinobacterium nitratireducens]GGO78053.1 hydrolase [Marinobacterium nitratireducens]
MIKCVTFDLDDTLWAVDPVIEAANRSLFDWLARNAELFTRQFSLADLPRLRREVLERHPEIGHSVTQIRLRLLEHGLLTAGYPAAQAEALALQAFEVFLDGRNQVEFFEHAVTMLQILRERGLLIGALSNGNADVQRVGLGDYFDFQFNADGTGTEKPHPLMFEQALEKTGLRPEQVVHIGDNPVADIEGAHNAGYWTIWVNLKGELWPGGPTPDQVVHDLSEIPRALTEIAEIAASRVTL